MRTGQAGKAPEREVIERYDISTYLTKVEATNEKLHATVVNAVRNYQYAAVYEPALGFTSWLISRSREEILRGVPEILDGFLTRRDSTQVDGAQYHFCILTDREAIAIGKFTGREAEARTLRDRLAREPSRVINDNGDRFAHSGNHVLFSLARDNGMPVLDLVGETNYHALPDFVLRPMSIWLQSIRKQMNAADNRQ